MREIRKQHLRRESDERVGGRERKGRKRERERKIDREKETGKRYTEREILKKSIQIELEREKYEKLNKDREEERYIEKTEIE